jgi:metacaspase-1
MTKFALLIGINYVGQSAELNGCINDVIIMRDILINKFGYKENNIIILSDETQIKPTSKNILNNLNMLVNKSKNGFNEFWLHYSGHGAQIPDENNDELDGYDEVIVPLDYEKNGVISDDILSNILNKLDNNAKMFCVMDCCHSGTILDLKYRLNNNNFWIEENKITKLFPNICMVSGCSDDQTSADAFIPTKDNSILWRGAMTWALTQCLKNNNYNVRLIDLIKGMRELLKKSGYTQIPQLSSSKRISIQMYLDTFIKQRKRIKIIKKNNNKRRRF